MKTKKQLVEERQAKLAKADEILKAENVTDEQRQEVKALHEAVEAIDADLEIIERQERAAARNFDLPDDPEPTPRGVQPDPQEEREAPAVHTIEDRDYSLWRAIQAAASKDWSDAKVEARASAIQGEILGRKPGERELDGHEVRGFGFLMPPSALLPLEKRRKIREERAAISKAAPGTAGAALIETQLAEQEFVEFLRPMTVLGRLGARFLTGLMGDVDIPRQATGATGTTSAEHADATESALSTDLIQLRPHQFDAYADMTRRMMVQSAIAIEDLVTSDLRTALLVAIDKQGIEGAGTGTDIEGVVNVSGIGSVTLPGSDALTWANMVELEADVETGNALMGSLGYLVNPHTKQVAKTTVKTTEQGGFLMEPDGTINGYRAESSTQLTGGGTDGLGIAFGNWADLLIGLWGGLDVIVDPYTLSLKGALRVVVFQDADAQVRHVASFSYGES